MAPTTDPTANGNPQPAMTAPEPTTLWKALDNLLRHHNSGSQHQDTARRNFECEFARQARAALATPPAPEPTPEQVGQTWERLAALGRAAQPWPATPPAALDVERLARAICKGLGIEVTQGAAEPIFANAAAIAAVYQQEGEK